MSEKPKNRKATKKAPTKKATDSQVKYGINMGQKVKEIMKVRGYSYQAFADKMRITKNGLANRLLKPHYGTFYDIIETSIALDYDFMSEGIVYIKSAGVSVDTLPAQAELSLLKSEVEKLNNELDRYRKIVDKLTKG